MILALAPAGPPVSYKRHVTKSTITSILIKRISCLKYLKNAHIGKEPWLDTVRISRPKWSSIYTPETARSYFVLGLNLGSLDPNDYKSIPEFLTAFHTMLHFFDLADKLRIEKNKQDQHKASKSLDNRSIGSMESLQIDTGDHNGSQQSSHHFRKTFSVFRKGLNSITPTSTSSSSSTGSHKKVTKKRSSHFSKKLMSFGSRHHHHASENGDSDSDSDGDFSSLSPVDSIASFVGAPSLPQQSSTHNQSHHNGSGMGKIQLFSAKSNSSGSNSSTTSSSRGHMNLLTSLSNSAISPGATKNARNAVTGTGTYTMMARKKPFFQNMRADHSTINQNQLTLPEFLTGLRKNSPAVRSAVENLLLVSEQDLPFVPDSVESIITLFDIVIGLYRLVLSDIENTNKYVTQTELNDLELLVASIEIILRRTVISESLIGLDSEYIKRTSFAQCRDAIEQDIIRACSQPNAIAPTKRSTVPSIKVV